jgi:HD superfamily phosphohydrolase
MNLEIVRRIRGNVHGTIDVTEVEDAVIGHESVQRLRRIRQLAFLHYVFPGATHTRFEHSLGVMQLAGIAWEKLRVNQSRLRDYARNNPQFITKERQVGGICHGLLGPTFHLFDQLFSSDYCLQILRLAALLHDIGHSPFSHSGEPLLPSWQSVYDQNPSISTYLKDWLKTRIAAIQATGKDPAAVHVRHEVFSVLLIDQILRDTNTRHSDLKFEVDPRDVVSVISPDIEPAENSPLLAHGIYKILHELIAGELDIDRMDYLLRDSRECGVVYGIFDFGRILDALCIYQDPNDRSVHVAIMHSGLAAFEDYLRARQSMYLQVYFHKTSSAAEAMMARISKTLKHWSLPAEVRTFAECDEYNIQGLLQQAAHERIKDLFERKDFDNLTRDLLMHRRLWKRVYEITAVDADEVTKEKVELIKQVMTERNINFEYVSSLTSLTRFHPRERHQKSKNYLRLILRDELNTPKVVPIEDHWSLAESSQRIRIHRFYAPRDSVNVAELCEIINGVIK